MNRRLRGPALATLTVATALTTALTTAAATLPAVGAEAAAPLSVHVAVGALLDAVPSWAQGTPDATEPAAARVQFVVQLTTRHEAELKRFAAAVSDPASSTYRHFLTPQRYRARYAPTVTAATTVTDALRAAGLTVDTVSPLRTAVTVHGTAAEVGSLFSTTFGRFDVAGLSLRSPLSAPVLPAALRGLVTNVAGLAQSAPLTPTATPSPAFVNARPCSHFYGQLSARTQPTYQKRRQAYAVCGYTGRQLRTAYGVGRTHLTGKGVTVGIVDAYASPTIEKDADTYARRHGDRPFRAGQFSQVLPPGETQVPEDPTGLLLDPQGWAGEETLDVEAVHAMAPDAKVLYQAAVSPYGPMLYAALLELVEGGKAQVVSDSYGTGSDSPLPTDRALFDQITTTAASMGVTIDFSSGDSGDETDPSADGARTADFPATSPGVTAVGGTTLEVDKKGHRKAETYWGTLKSPLVNGTWDLAHHTFSGAGGGGVSTTYAEPAWQKGVVPNALTTIGRSGAGRVEPDVSMVADSTTGFLMGQTQTFADGSVKYGEYRIGGTSLSCPLFSGVLALAVQRRHRTGPVTGLGLVTPTMYRAATTASARVQLFHDPSGVRVDPATHQSTLANVRPDFTDPTNPRSRVVYSLRTLGNLATLHRLRGYDDSTGLGSPIVAALVKRLARG